MLEDLKGEYVMIRTYSAGVHYGILDKFSESDGHYGVKLRKATRVYKWGGACSLSQLSVDGTNDAENTSLSVEVPSIYLKAIEVIEMTPKALDSLSAIDTWKI